MSQQIVHPVGIIMNGVTGRMGLNQHLRRSIQAIIAHGGVKTGDEIIMPRPLLAGRNARSWKRFRRSATGCPGRPTSIRALADPAYTVYFDAQTTDRRTECVHKAIAAGKHVYAKSPAPIASWPRSTFAGMRKPPA